jgi:hypothetical protein
LNLRVEVIGIARPRQNLDDRTQTKKAASVSIETKAAETKAANVSRLEIPELASITCAASASIGKSRSDAYAAGRVRHFFAG